MSDTIERLVLPDDSLVSNKQLYRAVGMIRIVNKAFDLGISPETLSRERAISDMYWTLRNPTLEGSNALLYLAIAKKLTADEKRRIDENGMEDDRQYIDIWRAVGCAELADHMNEWQDLADDVEIRMCSEAEAVWPEIANIDEINRRTEEIRVSMQPYV